MAGKLELGFLKSKAAQILTVVLVLQAAVLYGFARSEQVAPHTPLKQVPLQLGQWTMQSEGVVEDDVRSVLKADDILTRAYANSGLGYGVHLFVAYFNTQRRGQAPHSPKNCLPGSGWTPSESGTRTIEVPGRAEPISVNRYLVSKGDQKSLVMYWYQSRDRVVASEYTAKFFVVADAMRYNRTDTALVRVVVPVVNNDVMSSERAAVDFIKTAFQPLRSHFPA